MRPGRDRLFAGVFHEPARQLAFEWTQIMTSHTEITRQRVVQRDAKHGIADARIGERTLRFVASAGGRLATSTDRGRTWQLLKQDLPPIRSVAAARLV